mgnify:CR=1 FL=1
MKLFFLVATSHLLLIAGCDQPVSAAAASLPWQKPYDQLVQKYVASTGVRYEDWHSSSKDLETLKMVVDAIGSFDLTGMEEQSRLAFYLDAYNAWILFRILEDYPTKGPGGGGAIGRTAFFRSKSIRVAGEKMSFNSLENDIIRKQFKEPRIHFALNCASASCPPLHSRAFSASDLNAALDSLTRAFVNTNPLGVARVSEKSITISKIFDWYKKDFLGRGNVLDFINAYRDQPFPKETEISHQDYLWTLNEAH